MREKYIGREKKGGARGMETRDGGQWLLLPSRVPIFFMLEGGGGGGGGEGKRVFFRNKLAHPLTGFVLV